MSKTNGLNELAIEDIRFIAAYLNATVDIDDGYITAMNIEGGNDNE